jgi:hypothetical protein
MLASAIAASAATVTTIRHDKAPPLLPFIVRETDAIRANAIMNHPQVRPWVSVPGQDNIDLSNFVADERNVLLSNEAGTVCVAFHQHEPGIYEAHTAALPEARGPGALAAVQSMIGFMFVATDAMELLTRCPVHNPAAEALAQAVGGTMEFERAAAWPTDEGPVAVRHYRLDYTAWARATPLLPAFGAWFHDRLEAENVRLGIPDELHDDDPAHDRHVGAAVAMILAGRPTKAVVLYNRWARLAGYGLASIANASPLIIDIGTHLLRVHETGFEVLRSGAVQ